MKASCVKIEAISNVSGLYVSRRHISMKASSPYPIPQSMGPNNNIHVTFQQLDFDKATEPVMQMKIRIVYIG